jgi:hypothetical protein
MKYYNLDMVVRGQLFNKQYPIHWYAQFLKAGIDAIRELNLFHHGVVNTKLIKVDPATNSAKLPCDYVDYVRIGVANGPYNKPLVRNPNFNALNRYNSEGKKIMYDDVEQSTDTGWSSQWYESYLNDYGERLGRWFNHDKNTDTFEVIRERGEVQLHPSIATSHLVLEYISDGIDCDAATRVLPYHLKFIETYIDWQMKLHGRHYNLSERAEAKDLMERELRKVRAIADPLTMEDVMRIVRRSFTGTYKN